MQREVEGPSRCPLGCLPALHGHAQAYAAVSSSLWSVSPGLKLWRGVGVGGVVLISLSPSACVLVCERRREGTGDSGGGGLYEAWMPGGGENVFVPWEFFLGMSSTCAGAER